MKCHNWTCRLPGADSDLYAHSGTFGGPEIKKRYQNTMLQYLQICQLSRRYIPCHLELVTGLIWSKCDLFILNSWYKSDSHSLGKWHILINNHNTLKPENRTRVIGVYIALLE